VPSELVIDVEDMLQEKRLEKKIGGVQDQDLQSVKSFVFKHSGEILRDCK